VSSCGYAPIDNSRYIIITAVESYDSNFSDYYGKGNAQTMTKRSYMNWNPFISTTFRFRDISRKFQVGDTITFTKNTMTKAQERLSNFENSVNIKK
jgi:hypothetical protein